MTEVRELSRDFRKELQGFERVWKRVAQEKVKTPEGLTLMPRRGKGAKDSGRQGK